MSDSGYAGHVEKKADDSKPTVFGPTPTKKAEKPVEAKWRPEEALYKRVLAITAVEEWKARLTSGQEVEISLNQQMNFIATQFITTYEERFGSLPEVKIPKLDVVKSDAAIRRYAQAALKK
jgi:hypothetical protein